MRRFIRGVTGVRYFFLIGSRRGIKYLTTISFIKERGSPSRLNVFSTAPL